MKIIGAGISGLSFAYYLRHLKPTIYEKSSRAGGWIRTVEQDGFLFELGPRGFRPHADTLQLCKELGLKPLACSADAKKRFVLQGDQLKPFSAWMLLKNGLLRDLFAKPSQRSDESVADFFQRHFGSAFVTNLVDPMVKGIYAGNAQNLSVKNCFPSLWEIDQKRGRLLQKPPRSKVALYSFEKGMEELPKALAKRVQIEYGQTAEGIYACPTEGAPPYLSLTTVSMGWHRPLPKRGFGFLVPSKEKRPFLGMTWDSNVFPGQKGEGRLCVMTLQRDGREIA
ncbi:MAG: protoporphyrinogen oxidase, partial [Chlamydiae bacterium]|nr:protoporphyrinogen oxidase [Chlamydiota bacterium]